jgi:hypothetical protein
MKLMQELLVTQQTLPLSQQTLPLLQMKLLQELLVTQTRYRDVNKRYRYFR